MSDRANGVRRDVDARRDRVKRVIDLMERNGEELTISAVARRSRVSRQFFYRHHDLRSEVFRRQADIDETTISGTARSTKVTMASLQADLANADQVNASLRKHIARLEQRLQRTLGLEAAAGTGLLPIDEIPELRQRLDASQQQVFELSEQLRCCNEDLDAVRLRNRELISMLNAR